MKKFFVRAVVAFALVFAVSVPVLADTIRLKDGSVIRGQIVSFKNEQFTILVGAARAGERAESRFTWKTLIRSTSTRPVTRAAQPRTTIIRNPRINLLTSSRRIISRHINRRPIRHRTQPSYQPPATNTHDSIVGNNPQFFQINIKVRADNASNGWTNSGLVVRRGQRLRISASGRVSLGTNRYATPDGLPNIPDRDKLMRNQPTGGLIAVIGDDNDDFIFVGRGRDFVAQRDGVLFLGVNEGNLSDNSGNFDVVIEAEASGSR